MIDKKQLREIIQDLVAVVGESGILHTANKTDLDAIIFKEACTYQRGLMISNSKTTAKPSQVGNPVSSVESPRISDSGKPTFKPSPKQLKILKEAGLPEGTINKMTKLEVSRVIGEYLNSLKKENI